MRLRTANRHRQARARAAACRADRAFVSAILAALGAIDIGQVARSIVRFQTELERMARLWPKVEPLDFDPAPLVEFEKSRRYQQRQIARAFLGLPPLDPPNV